MKLCKINLCFLPLFFLWSFKVLHPFHVSIVELKYDQHEKRVQVVLKVFTDDLELALVEKLAKKIDISKGENKLTTDSLLHQYLATHFSLETNGKRRKVTYLGFEPEKDAMLIYMEVEKAAPFSTIGIACSILFEQFDDQINLLHVTNKGVLKSLRLTKDAPAGSLFFNNPK